MTTLRDYMRDFANDVVNNSCRITGAIESPEIELDEQGLENLIDDYIKMIIERMIGVEKYQK